MLICVILIATRRGCPCGDRDGNGAAWNILTENMITRERLKGAYSEGEALAIYNEARADGSLREFCQRFMYDEDYQVARNALWAMTKATDLEIENLQPLLHELIGLSMSTGNTSVRRLSLNIVMRLRMEEDDLRTDFLDFCLDHMADVQELPGIQSICMKLAYNMSMFYPELMGELMRTVEAMDMDYYSPAVRSVRRRIMSGRMGRGKRRRDTA